MKIEIKNSGPMNWGWRTVRGGGNITAWSYGANTKAGAIRSVVAENLAHVKLALGKKTLIAARRAEIAARVRAVIRVVD